MNRIFTMFLLLISLTSHAESSPKADFTCLSASGTKYVVYYKEFVEIHVYDKKGLEVDHYDSMTVKETFIESIPMVHIYKFVHEEGDVVASISEKDGVITFKGLGDLASCKK